MWGPAWGLDEELVTVAGDYQLGVIARDGDQRSVVRLAARRRFGDRAIEVAHDRR